MTPRDQESPGTSSAPDRGLTHGDQGSPGISPALPGLSPALVWAVTAWLASLAGWELGLGRRSWWSLGFLMVGLAVLSAWAIRDRRGGKEPGHLGATVVAAVVLAVVVGALAAHQASAAEDGPLPVLARRGGQAAIVAQVASEPRASNDGSTWLLVTVARVGQQSGRWLAMVAGVEDPPPVGSRVRATVTARPLGDNGFDSWLQRRHAQVVLDIVAWEVTSPPSGGWAAVERVRRRIRSAATGGLDGDAAGLAVGLVTGDTRLLSPTAESAMRATGLGHLVAVSGSNVALVIAVVAAMTQTLHARLRRGAFVLAVVAFVVMTRAEPSVLRAATMTGMVLLARQRGVPSSGVHALASALLVLLLIDPSSAGLLGLVLSAAATAGILVVAPVVADRLPRRLPRTLRLLLGATLGTQVAVAPVLLTSIGEVPLASIPANMVAVPAAAVASLVSVIGSVLAQVHLPGARLVMWFAAFPLEIVLEVARRVSGPVISPARPLGMVGLAAATTWFLSHHGSRVRRLAVVVALVATVAVGVGRLPVSWRPPSSLAVTAIDVGQGDALLVTTASGHRILVDTGPDDQAAMWLRRRGVKWLDLLVLTHAHADHVGGVTSVLANVSVGAIWVPVDPPTMIAEQEALPGAMSETWPAAVQVSAGMAVTLGSVTVEVLAPPGGYVLVDTQGGVNDRSIVLRVAEADRVALFTGDVEVAAQRWLLSNANLSASVLKVPHHGAATTEDDFLAAVAPLIALISVGADNDYGHPDPWITARLTAIGSAVQRTDLEGTITVVVPHLRDPPGG